MLLKPLAREALKNVGAEALARRPQPGKFFKKAVFTCRK
jgi:hypothetical protein